MRTVHVLQHVALEGPARIASVARAMGLGVVEHRLFEQEPPEAVPSGDLLVVMGGPMGVGDIGDARWPFLAAEARLLEGALRDGRGVLGVCLGAQLMAHVLGAKVYPLHAGDPRVRLREVGWGAVTFDATTSDPAIAGLQGAEVVVHWHGDTFDLPRGAVLLASTLECPHQMFRAGPAAYGLQFHVELSPERDLPEWVRVDAAFVKAAGGAAAGARILAETPRFAAAYERMGERMIGNVLAALLANGT